MTVPPERQHLQDISARIDECYAQGKTEEGRALLEQALAQAQGDNAYTLFFEGEWAAYEKKDYKAQEVKFRQAVTEVPDDVLLLRNLGVCLSCRVSIAMKKPSPGLIRPLKSIPMT